MQLAYHQTVNTPYGPACVQGVTTHNEILVTYPRNRLPENFPIEKIPEHPGIWVMLPIPLETILELNKGG